MAIDQISTANTFAEWLTTTSTLVAVANNLTNNTSGGFVMNSSIFIEGSAASLNVRTLANINQLTVNTISILGGSVDGNLTSANVTNNLYIGKDAFIYGNLTISGNVTLDTIGFDDLSISGSANIANTLNVGMSGNIATSLWVGGNTTIGQNLSVGNVSMTGVLAGPTSLTGPANNAIYSTISAAIDSSIAFAIALG